ncbi:MAG: hypothetical protein KKI15_02685 [Proteobacteria bacterium]|nr:hypothetical protein [Pseudomonadota bacterium]
MEYALDKLPQRLHGRLRHHRVTRSLRRPPQFFTDTSNFTAIDYGDIIAIDDRFLLVTGYTREGRFGIDEQVKPWVPRVEDLESEEKFILKLVFHETFDMQFGQFTINCYRNPEKEARVLELVKGHPHFMQGRSILDEANNLVRILDIVNGNRLDKFIHRGELSHQEYFYQKFPEVMRQFLKCVKGIQFLHENDLRHGDIRRDHIFVDRDTGLYIWIDFDYDFYMPERPFALDLYELGNILTYLTARARFHEKDILMHPDMGQAVLDTIVPGDLSVLSKNRIVNLKKLFPYIPDRLNNILLHFSHGTEVFYETVAELHDELGEALTVLG